MAEDFKIVVGTEIHVDKNQLQKDIDSAVKKMGNKVENVKVKVDFVDIENKARAAINRAQNVLNKANLKIKVGIDDASYKKALNDVGKQSKKQQENTKRQEEALTRYVAAQTRTLDTLESKAFKRDNPLVGKGAKEIKAAFKELRESLRDLDESIDVETKEAIKTEIASLRNTISELKNAQKQLNSKAPNTALKSINAKIGNLDEYGSYSSIANAKEGSGLDALRNKIEQLKKSYSDLAKQLSNTKIGSPEYDDIIRQLANLNNEYKKVTASAQKYATVESTQKANYQAALEIAGVQARLKEIGTNYSALKTNPAFLAEFENLVALSKQLDGESVKGFSDQVSMFTKKLKLAGLDKKDYISAVAEKMQKFTSWFDVSQVIMGMYSAIQTAGRELKELDSTLTEISKTSDRTSASLEKLGSTSFASASEFGVKANDYLTGIQQFSRAGFGAGTDEGLARLALQAQAAGDMTAELSQDYLLVTNAAYKLYGDVTDLTTILDGMNMVTNRNATSMVDLAEGFKVVASQAAGAKVQADELAAAIGTIDAVTRTGGNVAGRGFRTLLMNLQGADAVGQVTDDGEEITIESANKVGKVLKSVGVAAREFKDGVEVLRDPMEILRELSDVFNSLGADDARRADLLAALGGKYRANAVEALLSNWDMYEKMLKDYSEGSGSSYEEAMKSANNLEGSLNRLSNTWTSVVNNFADSKMLTFLVNLGNGFLSAVDGITRFTDSIGALANPGMLAALYAAFSNKGKPNMVMPCLAI